MPVGCLLLKIDSNLAHLGPRLFAVHNVCASKLNFFVVACLLGLASSLQLT